jgi:hypothetical protein
MDEVDGMDGVDISSLRENSVRNFASIAVNPGTTTLV